LHISILLSIVGVGKKMLADENCLRQFVMGEMLSQGMTLNQNELSGYS